MPATATPTDDQIIAGLALAVAAGTMTVFVPGQAVCTYAQGEDCACLDCEEEAGLARADHADYLDSIRD